MKFLDPIRFRSATLFRRSRMNAEMEEELRTHIAHRADDLVRSGMERSAAERQARIEFGGYQRYREESQAAAGGTLIESLIMDVRFGLRLLRKTPGFTVTAVLTLALAIGANAVVFAALNAFILRPLNVPRPDSLYSVHRSDNAANQSYPDYVDLRDRNHSFEDLAAYNIELVGLDADHDPSRAWAITASANYFDALGIQPYRGRLFHAADEHGPNSAPYVVLSYAYWHAHFHEDPGVVGRVVQINKHPFTVIGVTPPEFRGTLLILSPDIFVPIVNQEQFNPTNLLDDRANRGAVFLTMGHLKTGVTTAQAAADIDAVWSDIVKAFPKDHRESHFGLARPSLYGEHLGRPMRTFLSALMLMAVLILVAACANLGGLFAARTADRAREMALRLALGARTGRILRQLFTEAFLLCAAGGAVGLWGALLLLRSLVTWQPFPQFPLNVPLTPDANVYLMALLLTLASGLLFGAVPIRQVLRTDPYEIVKSGARTTPGRRFTFSDLLLVGQIAICAVLVTSSLVAVRGLVRSQHSGFGFEPHNVVLANTLLAMAGYSEEQVPPMQKRMLEAMQSIPGVTSVALADRTPMNGDDHGALIFRDDSSDLRPGHEAASANAMKISPEYLHTAGTTLLTGRSFTWHDDKDSPPVAVINQEFARRMFGSSAGAVGRYFKLQKGTRVQVVGVVEDGKYSSLTEEPTVALFLPLLQSPASDTWLVVRSAEAPDRLTAAIRGKLRELDSGLPTFIQTWDNGLGLALFPARMATATLGILGLIGGMLSVTGIFGMAAYSVSRRLKELGIRMALGAQRKEVLQAALGRAFRVLALGSAAGLVLGIMASRVLAFIVHHATPRDPVVLVGAVVAMLLLGLVATWVPAQRALRIDPLMLLREE